MRKKDLPISANDGRRTISESALRTMASTQQSGGRFSLDSGPLASILLENIDQGVVITSREGIIEYVNPVFCSISGFSPSETLGKTPRLFRSDRHSKEFYTRLWKGIDQTGTWRGRVWNRRKNGEIYPADLTICAVIDDKNGKMHKYVGLIRAYGQSGTPKIIYHDALTSLPNRILLNDRLDFMLAHARRNGQILAVLFLDLDRFKRANETFGYSAGDHILRVVSEKLKSVVREVDAVFRLGNDEFAVVLEEISHIKDAAKVAKKIQRAFSVPMEIPDTDHKIYMSASIGISLFPYDGVDMDSLVKNAETAMFRAKEQGESTHQHYTPSMDAKAFESLTIEFQLHRALNEEQFVVYYQPLMDMVQQRIVGAEALIRWAHPEMGLVSPAQFIPIAEETGLIVPIGEFVLLSACRQARRWQQQGRNDFRISVNLSARQFQQLNLLERISDSLRLSKLPPEWLHLEITESSGMKNPQLTIQTLGELKRLGIHISIDDFGTGYSSLNYLRKFPLDTLKIDQSFVRDIGKDKDDETIVAMMIAMAHTLNLEVVAEGVENEIQKSFLLQHGCCICQGYLYSPPVPSDKFAELLKIYNGAAKRKKAG